MAQKSENNIDRHISIKKVIMFIAIVPLLLASVIIMLFASWTMDLGLRKQVFANLKGVATGALLSLDNVSMESFHVVDDNLYKGNFNVTQNMGSIDYYAESNNVEITFFYGDQRKATTITDASGNRILNTAASPEVTNVVLNKGQEYMSAKVLVNGEKYYGYYMPISDTEQKIIGMVFAGKPTQEITSFILSRINDIIVIAIIISVLCMILSLYVTNKRFLKPVQKLSAAAKELAQGNIGLTLEKENNDEFGDLTDAFAVLIDNVKKQTAVVGKMADGDLTIDYSPVSSQDVMGIAIRQMIHDNNRNLNNISSATEQITGGVNRVASASALLAQGTSEQAGAIEQITISMSEIADAAKTNADNAAQANELAQTAKEQAEYENAEMEQLVLAIQQIQTASHNIAKVLKMIDDISFQTNIIALNASVEAARAGVHGRGFAVVAEEVRELAAKSADAAKNSAELVEDCMHKAETGVQYADSTADALKEIQQSIENMASLIDSIAGSSQEQSASVDEIHTGINQISDVVQTNSATSEECASISEELSNLAAQLENAVRKYHLH